MDVIYICVRGLCLFVHMGATKGEVKHELQSLLLDVPYWLSGVHKARESGMMVSDMHKFHSCNLSLTVTISSLPFCQAPAQASRFFFFCFSEKEISLSMKTDADDEAICLCFPPVGWQRVNVGRALYEHNELFRAALEECDRASRGELPQSLVKVLAMSLLIL